jgi:hypothetical protein
MPTHLFFGGFLLIVVLLAVFAWRQRQSDKATTSRASSGGPFGDNGTLVYRRGLIEAWSQSQPDGSLNVALVNGSRFPTAVAVTWNELGIHGFKTVTDLTNQANLGIFTGGFASLVAPKSQSLVKIA